MNKAEIVAKTYPSPLRYPGGKSALSKFFSDVINQNNIENGVYCEAYAGGAGAALDLLFSKTVDRIILNDVDFHIYAFWDAVLSHSDELINRLDACDVTIEEWLTQKQIYDQPSDYDSIDIGFSTFFLNRCNRGGILPNAGPIGGYEQTGNYLINARFNKDNRKYSIPEQK